jgi:GST-like protein
MYDVYVARSPAPWKVLIALGELGVPFVEHEINPTIGQQLTPEFKSLNPNSKVPVLVDHSPSDGGGPFVVFESGAILLYLAEKHDRLMPKNIRERYEALQWIMWQMAGLGPIFGNARHFRHFTPEPVPYGVERFSSECERLCSVLDRHLAGRQYIAGNEYSMADICCWPWLLYRESNGVTISDFRARSWDTYDHQASAPIPEDMRKILFGRRR